MLNVFIVTVLPDTFHKNSTKTSLRKKDAIDELRKKQKTKNSFYRS